MRAQECARDGQTYTRRHGWVWAIGHVERRSEARAGVGASADLHKVLSRVEEERLRPEHPIEAQPHLGQLRELDRDRKLGRARTEQLGGGLGASEHHSVSEQHEVEVRRRCATQLW